MRLLCDPMALPRLAPSRPPLPGMGGTKMRWPFSLVAMTVVACLAFAQPICAGSPSPSPVGPRFYLSLGDSLAAGFQPIGPAADDHRTDEGYADQLWALARATMPDLELVKLGCPGESSSSMMEPNPRCPRPHGSQLDEAQAFIAAHPGQIAFITIDLGFADFPCDTDASCVVPGLASIQGNLPRILSALTSAAPGTPIVGMTIYDPFLPAWLSGDEELARMSAPIVGLINGTLAALYEDAGARVADVQGAFSTTDFATLVTLPSEETLPLNVVRVCQWTWLCTVAPIGPDRHPNGLGYAAIAAAFWDQLGPLFAD